MRKVKVAILAATLLLGGLSAGYAVAEDAGVAGVGGLGLSSTSLIELALFLGLTTTIAVDVSQNNGPPASPG